MKKLKAYVLLLSIAIASSVFSSCKKDSTAPQTDLLYEVDIDGATATFKIKTKGVTNYKWDFGDGETSTQANPVHTYPGKGKYVPTLTASVNGKVVDASTVLRIAKPSPVKLNDNTLADWVGVDNNIVALGASKGIFRTVKFDYDGNNIYVYVEMESTKANADIFDFYIDSDNNTSTGLLTGTFPDGGYDILLEGQLLKAGLDIFYHKGSNQNAFDFDQQSIADAIKVGTIVQSGNIVKFEMGISRSKLKGLTGTGARFGIQVMKNDWSVVLGNAPDENSSSFFLDMSE